MDKRLQGIQVGKMKFFTRSWKRKKVKEEPQNSTYFDDLSGREMPIEKSKHYMETECNGVLEIYKSFCRNKEEYRVLTYYLTDIQKIENLPENVLNELGDIAKNILKLTNDKEAYIKNKRKLPEDKFALLEQESVHMEHTIKNLQENEKYQMSVKRDMQYLEGEKNEWFYTIEDLERENKFILKASCIVMVIFVGILLLLKILNILDMEVLFLLIILIGMMISTFFFVRIQKNQHVIKKARTNGNYAIQLLNKAKIKYVHITNAMDYCHRKFDVKNSYELSHQWEQFKTEKEEREKFDDNTKELDYLLHQLTKELKKYDLYDEKMWLNQMKIFVDANELELQKVELISRRQGIRSEMEFARTSILTGKGHILSLLEEYGDTYNRKNEIIKILNEM